jgi:hypothetical protein
VILRGSAVWLRAGRSANRVRAERDRGKVRSFIGAGELLEGVCLLYQEAKSRVRDFCDE